MKVCRKRLQKEYIGLRKEPVENIQAVPNDTNILEWHYIVHGPKDTVYEGGVYHGKLIFTEEYPYKPPAIMMCTRSGRFKTNTRLCLSMSDFHPETWNPLWSVGSILSGLLSFMLENSSTLGSIETSKRTKRELALKSMEENIKNEQFCRFFPHIVNEYRLKKRKAKNENEQQQVSDTPAQEVEVVKKPATGEKEPARKVKKPVVDDEVVEQKGHSMMTLILSLVIVVFAFFATSYM